MIELRVLGGCDLADQAGRADPGPVLAQPKRLGLLVYLGVDEPRGFRRRDTLLGLFWPEFEQSRARAALRRSLHFLRSHLGEEVLAGRGDEEIGLGDEAFWCDTRAFRDALAAGRPERALQLYAGEMLPGFFVSDAPGFERWLDRERDRLAHGALRAATGLADRHEQAGNPVAAAGWLRRAVEIAPTDEKTLRRLVTLLDAAGDRAGAVRAYEAFARGLAREYDVEPSPETRELVAAVRSRPEAAPTAGPEEPLHATRPGVAAAVRSRAFHSVAVLPLTNLGDDPEDAYFAEGVAEEITTAIARIADLRVISRTSVQPYRDSELPVREIAERLDVDALLEGSVRRSGGRVRISVQLVDARRDDHLWGETYDRELEDVFAIQSQVARRVAAALAATLSPAEERRIGGRPTASIAAYDLYLRGQERMERDRVGNETAIELFREAVRLDPAFAEAHAALATAYAHEVELFGASRNWSRIGIETARRAIALDPELPSAHFALGRNFETLRRLRDASSAYRRAVELNPSYATAISALAMVSLWAGDFETAVASAERALGVTPGDPHPFFVIGFAYYCLDLDREAERWYARALSLWPEFIWAEASLAYFCTVWGRVDEARPLTDRILAREPDNWVGLTVSAETALVAGQWAEARRLLERAYEIDPDGRHTGHLRTVAVALGFLIHRAGERKRASRLLERGEELNQRAIAEGAEFGGITVDLAAVHAIRGDVDEACRWLDRTYRTGWRQFRYARVDPTLGNLREDPRFEAWVGRMEDDVTRQRERTLARAGRAAPP